MKLFMIGYFLLCTSLCVAFFAATFYLFNLGTWWSILVAIFTLLGAFKFGGAVTNIISGLRR